MFCRKRACERSRGIAQWTMGTLMIWCIGRWEGWTPFPWSLARNQTRLRNEAAGIMECSLFQDGFPLTTDTFSYICVFWSTDAWSSELSFSFSAFKKWTIKRERVSITCYRWQPAWLVLYFNLYNFTVKASSQDCTSSSVILSAISWMLTAVISVLKNLKGKND